MTAANDILTDYKQQVEKMFDDGSDIMFTNKDRDHAAILISTLFNKAEKEVVVLCRNLDSEFYSRPVVQSAMLNALNDKGIRLRMIVQEEPQNRIFFDQLSEMKNVSVKVAPKGSRAASLPLNFTVTDRRAFRLEQDRNIPEATACANNVMVAEDILDLFDSLG